MFFSLSGTQLALVLLLIVGDATLSGLVRPHVLPTVTAPVGFRVAIDGRT